MIALATFRHWCTATRPGIRDAVLVGALSTGPGLALPVFAQSCPESAIADYDAGRDALHGGLPTKAVALLGSAASTCDTPAYWQHLGDAHLALLDAAPQLRREPHNAKALAAFGRAFAGARGAQDDTAGARAARSIADLGLRNGDPLKAQNWILVATRLEPGHPDLIALEERVDSARNQLSTNEIETGLSQTRGIGTVNNLLGGKVSSNAFWDPEDESAGGAGQSTISVSDSITIPGNEDTTAEGPTASIDIPLRFASNSTELTPGTRANVRNLASALTLQDAASRIMLTGHADVRGEALYNQRLSLARAEAIRDLLLQAEPTLRGRIDAFGAGESHPIDRGDTARAHANNRRLEVTVTGSTPGN